MQAAAAAGGGGARRSTLSPRASPPEWRKDLNLRTYRLHPELRCCWPACPRLPLCKPAARARPPWPHHPLAAAVQASLIECSRSGDQFERPSSMAACCRAEPAGLGPNARLSGQPRRVSRSKRSSLAPTPCAPNLAKAPAPPSFCRCAAAAAGLAGSIAAIKFFGRKPRSVRHTLWHRRRRRRCSALFVAVSSAAACHGGCAPSGAMNNFNQVHYSAMQSLKCQACYACSMTSCLCHSFHSIPC